MTIIHCLFWIKGDMVTSLLYDAGTLRILKFKGRKAVPLTDVFWDDWRNYSGMCNGDTTDFCLLYDEKPISIEALMPTQCEKKDCIWSRQKISDAVEKLGIKEPTEIRNENGILLERAGCFLNVRKEDIVTMTAQYRKADEDAEETELQSEQTTPFIEHYKGELEEYKKRYQK